MNFVGWLLNQREGRFVITLKDSTMSTDRAVGIDCFARRIYDPSHQRTLPLSMDSLRECAAAGRVFEGVKAARKLVRLGAP
jgi:hypothetical protein